MTRKLGELLFWIALFGVFILAAMYLSAMLVASDQGLQVTGMMELERGSQLSVFYGWFYTGALIVTALAGIVRAFAPFRGTCAAVVFFAGSGLALTLAPLVYSFLWNYVPSHFENYVGEVLTCLALILLALTSGRATAKTAA